MKHGILFGLLLSSSLANASHFEECLFTARVTEVLALGKLNDTVEQRMGINTYAPVVVIAIDSAKKLPGSYIGCNGFVGQTRILALDPKDRSAFSEGQRLTVEYRLGNSRSPDGGGLTFETWKVK